MDNFVCEASVSPPPPSYELSQNEFDQKTTRALEESAAEPPRPSVDDDGFEIWDDAVFEAALTALAHLGPLTAAEASSEHNYDARAVSQPSIAPRYSSHKARAVSPIPLARRTLETNHDEDYETVSRASGSSASRVRPLRVMKRGQPEKERPSWYEDAGLGPNANPPSSHAETSQAGSSSRRSSAASPRTSHAPRRQLTVFNHVGEAEREITPPPEFSAVGPSLDGPPYELVVMSYEGPELEAADPSPELPPFESSPETQIHHPPPVLPPPAAPPLNTDPPLIPSPPISTTVRSQANRTAANATAVHLSKSQPPMPATAPRLPFDPRMAYNRPLPAIPQDDPAPLSFDASAFYSHAVAAQFTSNAPTRRLPVQPNTRSSVFSETWTIPTSSNEFGAPAKAAPLVASPRPSYAYGRAEFPEADSGSSDAHQSRQQAWPPTGGGWR
ncbi:hypothetical protein GY45DRAFT_801520 [Cubamyces sp. BRFM 1775]|nr:hypothetical protein GY45DRAFT_801520 [Cubamyces sp. BRFM 1775]